MVVQQAQGEPRSRVLSLALARGRGPHPTRFKSFKGWRAAESYAAESRIAHVVRHVNRRVTRVGDAPTPGVTLNVCPTTGCRLLGPHRSGQHTKARLV